MHSSGSILLTLCEHVRRYLDHPTVDAKYNDAYLVSNIIPPAIEHVFARNALGGDNPIRLTVPITLVANTAEYPLPATLGQLWRVYHLDTDGKMDAEIVPQNHYALNGPGWEIDGNVIRFNPAPTASEAGEVWYVEFTSDCSYLPHYSEASGAVASDNLTVTLASTPTLGSVDRRPNAYAGQMLRVLTASNGVWQERVIASSTAGATPQVVLRNPFSPSLAGVTGLRYEIGPAMSFSLLQAISLYATLDLGAATNITPAKESQLTRLLKTAMKTVKDKAYNMQARTGRSFDLGTVDNDGQKE